MDKRERYKNRIDLLQGTLDMLILRTLQWGPHHGHGIGLAIRANSGELLQVETGSLYPALPRLEKTRLALGGVGRKSEQSRAKFHKLTALGKGQLAAEESKWELLVKAITGVMRPANGQKMRIRRRSGIWAMCSSLRR